jgi:DNA modification methylase
VLKDGGFIAIWQTQLYFKYFWKWFGDDIHIYAGCKNFVQLRKTPINYAYDPIVIKYKKGRELKPSKPKRSLDFFVSNTAKWVTQTSSLAREHPCPRPIDQVEQIIDNFVIEDGIVLDCFMGSGTTAVACINTNRKFIGIELEPKYVEIANKRIQEVLSQTKLMEGLT